MTSDDWMFEAELKLREAWSYAVAHGHDEDRAIEEAAAADPDVREFVNLINACFTPPH